MLDNDQMSDSPELRELRDSLSALSTPDRPQLEAILASGRSRRRHRRSMLTRLSAVGVAAAAATTLALALALSGTSKPSRALSMVRTPSFTLVSYTDGTAKLTLNPAELLDPAQLQSDFAKYGIPAKVTSGSYCTSNPEPAGFSQAVSGPGPGTSQYGEGGPSGPQPKITINPSQIPAGTELTVGYFQLATGQQQANFSLMNSTSYTCTSTPPDLSKPDTGNGDLGILYGGPGPSKSAAAMS